MTDESTDTPTDSPSPRPGPPPLRIHHILLATAVTAVALSLQKWLLPAGGFEPNNVLDGARRIWSTISTSLAFTAVGFTIAWRRAGYPFLRSPGHWLLLVELLPSLVSIPLTFYALMRSMGPPTSQMWPFHVYFAGTFFGLIGLTILAVWKGVDSTWRRAYFIFQGCVYVAIPLVALIGVPASHAIGMHSAGLLALLVAAIIADHRASRSRDWLHWLGTGLMCLTTI